MKRLALAVAILIALATPSQADILDGWAAFKRSDYATALQEFKPLAEQGDADAQYWLGVMYRDGKGVAQDYAEAAKWYRKSAEQGQLFAQVHLGRMYFSGKGVPQDNVRAHMWFTIALRSQLIQSVVATRVLKLRDRVAERMTPAQVAEAQRLAREWKPKPE